MNSDPPKHKHFSAAPIMIGFLVLEILIISMGVGQWKTARHHTLARRLAQEKRYDESTRHYEALLKKYPQAATINYEAGLVYLKNNQPDMAIGPLQIAALSDAPPKSILTDLGVAYMGANETKDALDFFREAMKENPRDPVASFFIGEDLYTKKQYVLAASFLEKAAFHPVYGKKTQKYLKDIAQNVFGELAEK